MRAGAIPKTSQINLQQFMDFWRPLLTQGLPIVHISLGSGVSGTYRNGTLAAQMLKGTGTTVAVVVGFPHGASRSEVKALEAKLAIEDGADELDMVMNIGKFLSGDYDYVKRDIEAVVAVAKPKGVLVKVIQESCLLTLAQVAKACEISIAAGADFVKTSTGFNGDGATVEQVAFGVHAQRCAQAPVCFRVRKIVDRNPVGRAVFARCFEAFVRGHHAYRGSLMRSKRPGFQMWAKFGGRRSRARRESGW